MPSEPKLLSADPNAGRLLSSDPLAGMAAIAPAQSGGAHLATGPQTLTDDAPLEPGWKDRLNDALSGAAHPQTLGDLLSLAVPSGVAGMLGMNPNRSAAMGNVAGDIKAGAQAAYDAAKEPSTLFEAVKAGPKFALSLVKNAFGAQNARQSDDALIAAAQAVRPTATAGPRTINEAMAAARGGTPATETAGTVAVGGVKPPPSTLDPLAQAVRDQTATGAGLHFSAPEVAQGLAWMKQGLPQEQAIQRILSLRQLQASPSFSISSVMGR